MVTIYRRMSPVGQGFVNVVSVIFLALHLFLLAGSVGLAGIALAAPGNQAVKASTATLRVGKHAHYIRLVFETSESYVQKASVSLSGANAINVDFQSPISFRVPGRDA